MKCLLCDINASMREAWKRELVRRPELAATCEILSGNITGLNADAVVSPANSFGFMRGGVDGVYTRVFGSGVEAGLQAIIRTLPSGELPVGEALVVPTGHGRIPWLISAPTMRTRVCVRSLSGHGYGNRTPAVRRGGAGDVRRPCGGVFREGLRKVCGQLPFSAP